MGSALVDQPAVTQFNISEYEKHPNAKPLPPLSAEDREALKCSIREEGLREPIQVQRGTPFILNGVIRHDIVGELLAEGHVFEDRFGFRVTEVDVTDEEVRFYTVAQI